jgi:hypothetical protein
MVCSKCEKKLTKVACPEKWKDGSEGRAINENKALSKKQAWAPHTAKCTVCKSALQASYTYCQPCAYRNGLCAMCGKQVLDLKGYKQSTA